MIILSTLLAVFFATNMGGSSFAVSFAASFGGKIIGRQKAGLLFVVFVFLGSFLLGKNVAITLGSGLVPAEFISTKATIVIFFSAGFCMFVSNLIKIPQSTSLVTVAAIAGVGVFFKQFNVKALYSLIPFWILLPVISYFLTRLVTGCVYPPRKGNFWIYERFVNHKGKLKTLVIVMSCYNAFAVGANNVANVAGPLMASSDAIPLRNLLIFFAFIYGAGAFIFVEPIKTTGHRIIPLGLFTASIISMVSGTLMIVASAFGVPQSFVMLQMGAIFAVSSLKDGQNSTFQKSVTKKTLYTWTINPLVSFFISLGLSYVIIGSR